MSVLSHEGLVERFFFFLRFEESTNLIEKEWGRKRKNFLLEMKKKKKKERKKCKVEFYQPSCWLYSVSNLFVFQQLVTLYLGGILVRVTSKIV